MAVRALQLGLKFRMHPIDAPRVHPNFRASIAATFPVQAAKASG
jgi:hypothetical protein